MRILKISLVVSVILNLVLSALLLKPNIKELKQSLFPMQPSSITYFRDRDEIFRKLPVDSNEIIMLGNSLTQGFEWNEVFEANVKNRGINSDITKGVLGRLDDITKNKPLKIFIEIGINDLARNYPIDTIFNNYDRIIEKIKLQSPSTSIYIQSIFPTSNNVKNITKLNQMLQTYCINNNLTYIELYSKFVLNNTLNPIYDCGDGVHLSAEGYLLWCDILKEYIK